MEIAVILFLSISVLLLIIALLIPLKKPPPPPDGGVPTRVFELEQTVSRNEGLLNSNVSTTAFGHLRIQKLETQLEIIKNNTEDKTAMLRMIGEFFAEKKRGKPNGKKRRVRHAGDAKRKATKRSLVETSGLRPIDGGKEKGNQPEERNPS